MCSFPSLLFPASEIQVFFSEFWPQGSTLEYYVLFRQTKFHRSTYKRPGHGLGYFILFLEKFLKWL
jgi:hypothetical protein